MSSHEYSTTRTGLKVLKSPTFFDARGFFNETYTQAALKEQLGIQFNPVQMNHSRSIPGVIRGLHAERWNKLVHLVRGKIFIALVDLRPQSPAFAVTETFILDANQPSALFIPEGFANSLCVLGNAPADQIYLVDKPYIPGQSAPSIRWNDPDLAIPWPIENPIISAKDQGHPTLRELFPEKFNNVTKSLIIGASGNIGSGFVASHSHPETLLTPTHHELNITSQESISRYFAINGPVGVIALLAAYTNVSKAEQEPQECQLLNVAGVANLLRFLPDFTYLSLMSTAAVKNGINRLTRETKPIKSAVNTGIYAMSKLAAERLINHRPNTSIVRIHQPQGGPKPNWVDTVMAKYRSGESVRLFHQNHHITLTSTTDINTYLPAIIEKRLTGIFHIGSPDTTTPYLFICSLTKLLNIFDHTRIIPTPVPTELVWRHPPHSELSVSRSQKILGPFKTTFAIAKELVDSGRFK